MFINDGCPRVAPFAGLKAVVGSCYWGSTTNLVANPDRTFETPQLEVCLVSLTSNV